MVGISIALTCDTSAELDQITESRSPFRTPTRSPKRATISPRSPDTKESSDDEEKDHVPLRLRPLRKHHTVSCGGDLSSENLQQRRRRSSIAGFETTVADARRGSVLGRSNSALDGPSRGLEKRRSSVIGCETASRLHRLTNPILKMSDVKELTKDEDSMSSSSSSSSLPSRSSQSGSSQSAASRPNSSTRMTHVNSISKKSTLQNSTEASRMREELLVVTPHIHRRSSVLSLSGVSSASRFSAHSSNRGPGAQGFAAPRLGRRASVIGPRFRTQSTLDFMQAISHECLKQVDLFKKCDMEFVEILIELARAQLFQVDHEIIKEGEVASALYILAHGTVEIRTEGNIVDAKTAVCILGHESLLNDVRSVATISSKTFCDCRVIERHGLHHALGNFPYSRHVLTDAAKKYVKQLAPQVETDRWMPRPKSAASRLSMKSPFRKSLSAARSTENKSSDDLGMHDNVASANLGINRRRSSVIGFEKTREDHRRGSAISSGQKSAVILHRRASVLGLPGDLSGLIDQLPQLAEHGAESSSSGSSSSSLATDSEADDKEVEDESSKETKTDVGEETKTDVGEDFLGSPGENEMQLLSSTEGSSPRAELTSQEKEMVAKLGHASLDVSYLSLSGDQHDELPFEDALAQVARPKAILGPVMFTAESTSAPRSQPPPFWTGLNVMKTVRWRSFGRPPLRHKGLTIPRHCTEYSRFHTRTKPHQTLQHCASAAQQRRSKPRLQPTGAEPIACDFADLLEQCERHVRTEWPEVMFFPHKRKTCFTSSLTRPRVQSIDKSTANKVDDPVPAIIGILPKLKTTTTSRGRKLYTT